MNSRQFKNLLYFGCNTISKLHLIDSSFYEGLDEIRKSNGAYKKIAESIYLNPNHLQNDPDAQKNLYLIKNDIVEECRNVGVGYTFLKLDKESYARKTFIYYSFQDVKLTSIINI